MLTSVQSTGVTPDVNLGITQVKKHATRIHPGFETQTDVTRSPKQGYQWLHEKDNYVLQIKKIFFRESPQTCKMYEAKCLLFVVTVFISLGTSNAQLQIRFQWRI